MENPMKPICGAHARTTGNPCQKQPLDNGRCRLHGGLSTGRPPTHGFYTKEAIANRARLRDLIKGINAMICK